MPSNKLLLGTHCSIRKSLVNALEEAKSLNCSTLQIFTCNPRRWNHRKYTEQEILEFNKKRVEYRIGPLIAHVFYLPNLATSDKALYKKSVDLLVEDLKVSEKINVDYFIVHLGAYSIGSTLNEGIKNICAALNLALSKTAAKTVILLENVSGGGRRVGSSFAELKTIIDKIRDKSRIGVCLDTAHLIGAGYPFSNKKEVEKTIKEFNDAVGLKYMKAIHLNDSRYPLNSRKDGHAHIGEGYIGKDGIRAILKHPELKTLNLPFILETPKNGPDSDKKNLKTVRKLYCS